MFFEAHNKTFTQNRFDLKLILNHNSYIYMLHLTHKTIHVYCGYPKQSLSLKYLLFRCCSYLKEICSPLLEPSLLLSDRPLSLEQLNLPVCDTKKSMVKCQNLRYLSLVTEKLNLDLHYFVFNSLRNVKEPMSVINLKHRRIEIKKC